MTMKRFIKESGMPTIYDVAQKARVSVGTVSNVINGKASVSPKLICS